jgi:hypothetical protein
MSKTSCPEMYKLTGELIDSHRNSKDAHARRKADVRLIRRAIVRHMNLCPACKAMGEIREIKIRESLLRAV